MRSDENPKKAYMAYLAAQKEAADKELATIEDDARRSLKADRHLVRKAIAEGNIYLEPDPDPQQYVEVSQVMEGTE
jgi:hypothetical protein